MLGSEHDPVKQGPMVVPRRIVSGGQTGVDRAALDVALSLGIPCGGWCPAGRRAEDGVIHRRYPLRETVGSDEDERTRRNVADADATLILARPPLEGGTALTRDWAERLGKAILVVELGRQAAGRESAAAWLSEHNPGVLNVAGPRESESPGIYRESKDLLTRLWSAGEATGGPREEA